MLPWRVGRALAISGGVLGILVGLLASAFPVGGWSAQDWSRALVVPLALLLGAAVGLRARAGPHPAARVAWALLVVALSLVTLAALLTLAPAAESASRAILSPALYVGMFSAFGVGVAAGARRAIPRAAAYTLLLAPLVVLVATRAAPPLAGAAIGFGLVFLVVGSSTID